MKKHFLSVSAFLFTVLALPVEAYHHNHSMMKQDNIVETAIANQDFSTLVSLLAQEGLAGTLSGNDNFTVFAPTNKAFDRMPNFYKRKLASNPGLLKEVLLSHVVPGKVNANMVLAKKSIATANGNILPIGMWNNSAYVSDSKIVATDVSASNGIIHVIDRVIVPRNLLR